MRSWRISGGQLRFLELAERFHKSKNPAETERLREELARMTFGN